MSDYNIPFIEPVIDYSKVPPINQKRTISFINHFIIHTVTFLNKFALSCEERLFEFENKLQKVEASLVILESRLSSIPGLDKSIETQSESTAEVKLEEKPQETLNIDETNDLDSSKPKIQETETQPISKDPRYEKYFKMMQFGVPKPAVKLKMQQEGLDSSILDNPQQLVLKQESKGKSETDD